MQDGDETGLTCYDCGEPLSLEDVLGDPKDTECPHCGAGRYE